MEEQPKIVTIIIGINEDKLLMHQRKREPFYNYWGFPGGKVKLGESIKECAEREFYEETGLRGEVELKGMIEMKTYNNGKLEHHHHHNIFSCKNTSGKLIDTDEGPNMWMNKKQINTLLRYPDTELLIDVALGKEFRLIELKRTQNDGKFTGMEIISDKKLLSF